MAEHLSSRRSSLSRDEKKRGPTHRPSVWAGAISIVLLLLISSLRLFGGNLYEYPDNPPAESLPKDSVIVCLAGGKYRIEAAFSLYANGVGDRLVIVGAGKKATKEGLAKLQAVSTAHKIPLDRYERIIVETDSRNTIENSHAVKRFLEQNPQVKKILLVTSSYHMRRAQLMIASQWPHDLQITPYTPPNSEIGRGNWWHTWLGITITSEEYFKLLMVKLILTVSKYF